MHSNVELIYRDCNFLQNEQIMEKGYFKKVELTNKGTTKSFFEKR